MLNAAKARTYRNSPQLRARYSHRYSTIIYNDIPINITTLFSADCTHIYGGTAFCSEAAPNADSIEMKVSATPHVQLTTALLPSLLKPVTLLS